MRLTTDMMKGKTVCWFLVSILVVGMVMLPFPAIERAEASTVTNVWVELSDDTVLNSTSTALEYIVHFTATTALTGGVDTITVTFPDGTTEMAGEEGSGYAFTLPSSILATYVAVDPDGAATTTIGYTDCYTDPDVGTYRVRLKLPMDIAAGASPYIKFETGAAITSASTKGTTYRVKVVTSQDTTAVYSEYFSLGSTAVTGVGHLSGYPNPATVGSAAAYKFEFTVGSSGALAAGSGTITVIFPSGTTVPASASKNQVQVDADGIGTSYSLTECTVHPTCHPDSRTVTLTVPQAVANNANVYVYFREGFGLVNPTTSTSTAKVKIYTSAQPKYAKAATGYAITAGSATKLEFANKSGAYSDDATMVNMYSSAIYLQLQDQYGNKKAPSHDLTVGLSSTSSTGKFYSAAGSEISSATIYDGTGDPGGTTAGQFSFLYKDSAAGTHTITASVAGYTLARWTVTVAPAVSIYDSDNEIVNTYAPTSTSPVAEDDGEHGGDYIQNAVNDAAPGETVKLGDGIYEVDSGITVAKAISLESVNGAAFTTLRPTTDDLQGVWGNSASDIFAVGASGAIIHYDGSSWSSMTSGTTNNLYGVWGRGASDVFAVGASGTILNYDGTDWSSETSGTTNTLYGVWETSDGNHVFAVGDSGTILYSTGGGSWSSMSSGTTNNLRGVWGSSASDVFAVGASGTIVHYDGSSWSSTTSGTSNLYGVWGSSASDVFAVGASGTIRHYNGTDWTESTNTDTNNLYGVWGISSSDVFAVGASGTILHYTDAWSSMTSGTTNNLRGVWGTASDNVFAVGASGTILHYDGTWSSQTSGTNNLFGVWGSSSSDVFAVGASGTILHYDGTDWSSQTSGTTNDLYGVWGNSGSDVYAVGASGTIRHYNGSAWSESTNSDDNNLFGIWGNASDNVYAVGALGTIRHYNGSAWSESTNSDDNNLFGIWGNADNDVYAVGASATIVHYNGSAWSATTSGANNLYGVWVWESDSTTYAFAVGASGTIRYYNGSAWSESTNTDTNNLYGVWETSDGNHVFAVGASGTILHYDGSSWSSQTSGTTNNLYGVWGSDSDDVFAVGVSGTILHYDGPSWSSTTSRIITLDKAINITATGSATYGVTIDGITFERLRSGTAFNYGIYDSYADYITVQNCVFNYMYNRGVMLTSTNAFTNGTISNNTFSSGGGSDVAGTDAAIDIRVPGSNAISGITISVNTITDQKGKGIYLAGQDSAYVSSVSITNNTITSATSYGIQGDEHTDTISITSNTITGSYEDGIYVKGTAYTIKKNVVTANIGDGIDVGTTSASHLILINYNDIYNNTGYGVNVRSGVTTVDTKYNWWGSATGPTYTAATGASVDVSNPGGTGDNITDRVTYYEWLYKPIADVIADNAAYYTRAVNLSVGWNTLSTPIILDASGDTVDEVVDATKMTIAYWYDTNDADSDGIYWEQVTTGYELEPCDAIYIKMNTADTVLLKYNAIDLSTPTKDLYAGWNLIGLANLETKHVDDAVKSVANTPTNLPGYSQVVSPSMNSSDWTYSSGQSYTDQDMLVGEGYWIYMQNDCTLAGFTITPIQPSLD